MDSGGPKEQCVRWIPYGKGQFWEEEGHCNVWGLSAVSCAETAEPLEMLFRLWTCVGPRKHVLNGCPDNPCEWVSFRGRTSPDMLHDTLP